MHKCKCKCKITGRVPFFSSKISMITNMILILYNSSINNKLMLRYLCFSTILPVFAAFCRQKIIPNSYSDVLSLSDSFLNESMNRLNDSVQSQRLTC